MTIITPIDIQQIVSGTDSIPRGILSRNHDQKLSKMDHPLKGLLRDKGRSSATIEEMIQLHKRAALKIERAGDALVELVREKNDEYGGGLFNLKHNRGSSFQWRANGRLAAQSNGTIKRTASLRPFSVDADEYIVIDQVLRSLGAEARAFYRAIDNVTQELTIRHIILTNAMRYLNHHVQRTENQSEISPRAQKISEDVLSKIWHEIESEKTF